MNLKLYALLILTPFYLLLSACGGSSNGTTAVKAAGSLISSSVVGTQSASLLQPYAVNAHKIVYYTADTDGNLVQASGLLSVPAKAFGAKSPILSYQHGTIFLDSKAPSNSVTSIDGINKLAGVGFIVSAPDYLGYGASASLTHPYIHAESLASASIDMLRASKVFLSNQNTRFNDQLFLAGYSEGGYATLALQKEIKESLASEFTVTASAPGAGPFDLSETAKTLANKTTNSDPSYMSFVLKAYDEIYALGKIDEMYQAPYRQIINTYFDGTHSGSEIDSSLTATTADLFEAPFLAALQGSGSHVIKDKLELNNIYDWKPDAPTRLYHGQFDEVVPYRNAQKAFDTMLANGATNISLEDCPLITHVQCAVPYVLDALNFFSSYAEDL